MRQQITFTSIKYVGATFVMFVAKPRSLGFSIFSNVNSPSAKYRYIGTPPELIIWITYSDSS